MKVQPTQVLADNRRLWANHVIVSNSVLLHDDLL